MAEVQTTFAFKAYSQRLQEVTNQLVLVEALVMQQEEEIKSLRQQIASLLGDVSNDGTKDGSVTTPADLGDT